MNKINFMGHTLHAKHVWQEVERDGMKQEIEFSSVDLHDIGCNFFIHYREPDVFTLFYEFDDFTTGYVSGRTLFDLQKDFKYYLSNRFPWYGEHYVETLIENDFKGIET